MSFTGEMPRLQAPPADQPWPENMCTHCGAGLREDQEWCLECGGARTVIHRPPDWRIAAAVIGVVVGLVLAGFAIALVNLSASANGVRVNAPTSTATAQGPSSPAAAATTPGSPAATATTPTSSTPSAPAASNTPAIAGWPVGLSGWTVVLAQSRSEAGADTKARELAASAGTSVLGVLHTDQHPSMPAGYWVVFAGRYPTETGASAAAQRLQAKGVTAAVPRRVAPPGGL